MPKPGGCHMTQCPQLAKADLTRWSVLLGHAGGAHDARDQGVRAVSAALGAHLLKDRSRSRWQAARRRARASCARICCHHSASGSAEGDWLRVSSPEILEAIGCQLGVADGVLD